MGQDFDPEHTPEDNLTFYNTVDTLQWKHGTSRFCLIQHMIYFGKRIYFLGTMEVQKGRLGSKQIYIKKLFKNI